MLQIPVVLLHVEPTAMILPSACTATSYAASTPPKVRGEPAIPAESNIQRTTRVVTCQGKIRRGHGTPTHDHDLTVGLDGNVIRYIISSKEIGSDQTIAAKGCVQVARSGQGNREGQQADDHCQEASPPGYTFMRDRRSKHGSSAHGNTRASPNSGASEKLWM